MPFRSRKLGSDLPTTRQQRVAGRHRTTMHLRFLSLVLLGLILGFFLACTNESPDQIRQKTAEETAALKRDSKAVAEGVKDGLSNKKSVDLNKASKDDLASLPGITSHEADRIIAERPYANTHQLVTRHVLAQDEYAQIQDRVVVNP
ncbi:MAG TPA: helix-hairpin-helix domain-containing protein [Candidatus Sulfotelmatobacter sp.]|nr:helix-hairpin-helix domain-containing protein [Candidatus Sulfotelmatobacter sp.]